MYIDNNNYLYDWKFPFKGNHQQGFKFYSHRFTFHKQPLVNKPQILIAGGCQKSFEQCNTLKKKIICWEVAGETHILNWNKYGWFTL